MTTVMEEVLHFLEGIGLFTVVLPFLLIYVMVFALLERTRIFGVEKVKVGDSEQTFSRKNLNAIFAFTIAFFAIMSARVVGVLHRSIGPLMILLLCIVLFLMFVSVFEQDGKYTNFEKGKTALAVVILIAIVLIFLGSIQTDGGMSWLEFIWRYATERTNTGHVGAIILLLLIAGMVAWLGKTGETNSNPDSED